MCYYWSLHYSTAAAVAAGAWHCIWTKDNLDFMPTNTIRKLNREVFCLELLKTNELIRVGIKLTSVYFVSWLFPCDAILCNLELKTTIISKASNYFEEQWLKHRGSGHASSTKGCWFKPCQELLFLSLFIWAFRIWVLVAEDKSGISISFWFYRDYFIDNLTCSFWILSNSFCSLVVLNRLNACVYRSRSSPLGALPCFSMYQVSNVESVSD